ncbi:MAG: Adenylate cyclase [Actinomycetia bacterium]|nr:Adenylate cyclase [Actinomycetes bacterium]
MPERVDLRSLAGCFDGVIPPVIATCSTDGDPNITHLSQLFLVDDDHVAASNQFSGKTTATLADNPLAAVLVTDSRSYETYHLDLRFERTETSGPLFEELRRGIEAIAALMNMEDVFALRGADIYRVLTCRSINTGD